MSDTNLTISLDQGSTENPPPTAPKITRRKQRFADEYLTGVTGAEAVRRTGYKGDCANAARIAYKWLRDAGVKAYIAQRRLDLEESTGIRQERVLRRLNCIVESTVQDLKDENGNEIPIHKLSQEVAASVQEIEYQEVEDKDADGKITKRMVVRKVKQHSPTQAAEQIARQLGWNKDSLELKGKLNTPPPVIHLVPYDDPEPDTIPN
jgi:phage terminase small subunit